ncbi:MAG: NAD(P)-dependent oxidoreductase [Chloroflexota bacterium]
MSVGLIGLGAMGRPMGHRLLRMGFRLTVLKGRDQDAARALGAAGAGVTEPPASALMPSSDVVLMALPGPAEVIECVTRPDGLLAAGKPGQVLVDLSTGSPAVSRRLAQECHEKAGVYFLDAGVTKQPPAAERGELSIMIGGAPEGLTRARPVLQALGKQLFYMGPPGSGHATKLLNNLLLNATRAAMLEASAVASRFGLAADCLQRVLCASSADSWSVREEGPQLLSGDDSMVRHNYRIPKDLSLLDDLASDLGIQLELPAALRRVMPLDSTSRR